MTVSMPGDGWTVLDTLSDPADRTVPRWLDEQALLFGSADRKTLAALLIGRYVGQVGTPFVALYLMTGIVPDVEPGLIAVRAEGGRTRETARIFLRLPCDAGACPHIGRAKARDALRQLLLNMFGRLVERLVIESGLSRGALWRLVGDSLCYAFLHAGRDLDIERLAMDEAMLLVMAPGSPTSNRRVGFIEITVPSSKEIDGPLVSEWVPVRGGCCRVYFCVGRDLCIGCVLRKPAEQHALWRAHLIQKIKA